MSAFVIHLFFVFKGITNKNDTVSEKLFTKYLKNKPQLTKKILSNSPIVLKRLSSKRSLDIETSLGLTLRKKRRLRTAMKNVKPFKDKQKVDKGVAEPRKRFS